MGSHVAVRSEMLKVCIKYKMYWTQVISYQNISNIWLLQPTCCNGVQVIPIVLFPPSYHFAKEILQLLHFQFACLTLPLWTLHWHGHRNIYCNTLNASAIPFNQVRSQIILWASVCYLHTGERLRKKWVSLWEMYGILIFLQKFRLSLFPTLHIL